MEEVTENLPSFPAMSVAVLYHLLHASLALTFIHNVTHPWVVRQNKPYPFEVDFAGVLYHSDGEREDSVGAQM